MIRRVDRLNGKHPSIGGGHAANESEQENGLYSGNTDTFRNVARLSPNTHPLLKSKRKIQTNKILYSIDWR